MTSAIATVTLTIINYLHLKELRTARLDSLTREIKEKIYSKLYNQLKAFLSPYSHTQEDIQTGTLPIGWPWTVIKNENFHLAYQLPKRIFTQLNEFTKIFDEYKKCFEQILREIRKSILLELKKFNQNIDTDSYLRIEFYFSAKKGGLYFNMFENLFLLRNLAENIRQFKLQKEIDSELICRFLNGANEKMHSIENEQEVIRFFEKLFKDIKENSENFKELLRLRDTGKKLAKQILKQIGPE